MAKHQPEYCGLRTKQVGQRTINMHLIYIFFDNIEGHDWSYLQHPHCQKVATTSVVSWLTREIMDAIHIATLYWHQDFLIPLVLSTTSTFSPPSELASIATSFRTNTAMQGCNKLPKFNTSFFMEIPSLYNWHRKEQLS